MLSFPFKESTEYSSSCFPGTLSWGRMTDMMSTNGRCTGTRSQQQLPSACLVPSLHVHPLLVWMSLRILFMMLITLMVPCRPSKM